MAGTAPSGPIVGRAAERAELARLVLKVAGGDGGAVLVEGEAGIGKTRLVDDLAEMAPDRGVSILVGAARPFESTRPFGAIREALSLRRGSSDPRRAAIAQLLGGEVEGHRGAATTDLRHHVVDEILDLVEVLSRAAPVVLVLEDLHWADDSTILAFRALLDRTGDLPVLLVGTLRPSPRSPALDVTVDDAAASGASVLHLPPLSPDAVDALVTAEIGGPYGPDIAAVVNHAAGNPLWTVELLRSLAAEGRLGLRAASGTTAPGLPDSFRQLVVRRLRYLPDATLELLRLAAVLGDPFSLVDLATVTGRRAVDLLADLAPAVHARLLGDEGSLLTFRHQLVHDAIYEDIPLAGRIALHREAAQVLAEAGAPLAQIAAHLMRGASPGDLRAVGTLRAAAREALPHAPDVAMDILEHAEALLPEGHEDRDLVTADFVEALLRAGRVAECAVGAEAALPGAKNPDAAAALRLSLISALSLQNRAAELIVESRVALTATPAFSDRERALALAQTSYGLTFSGDLHGGEAAARTALEAAERSRDAGMTVWSLTTLSFAVKTQGRYREAVDLAQHAVRLALDSPDDEGRLRHPHFFLGMALTDADRLPEAREAYRKGFRECTTLGSSWILPDLQQLSGELHFLLGEWDDALTEIDAGLAAAAAKGNQVPVAQSLGYRAVVAVARGDRRAARAALAPLTAAVEDGSPAYGMEVAAYARALLREADREPERAYEILRRFWDRDAERHSRRFQRYLAPGLVRLSLALDQPAVADAVVRGVEEAVSLAPEVPGVRTLALRCRALLDGDPEMATAAAELARGQARVLDVVGTLEDAATLLASAGRVEQARSLLGEALDRYEALPATAWAGRVRARLRVLGVRQGVRGPRRRPSTGWASLTDTERAVARLVAEGLTNREVGERLYISANTVGSHLRHLFQKLDVSSRAALTAMVVPRLDGSRLDVAESQDHLFA
jgi:DNA-binding CsgD family transcriptional regulator